jgi:hypothetical protein
MEGKSELCSSLKLNVLLSHIHRNNDRKSITISNLNFLRSISYRSKFYVIQEMEF